MSLRKILLNSYYYNFYNNGEKNPFSNYSPKKDFNAFNNKYKIYYDNIPSLNDQESVDKDNFYLMMDEEILNELFPYFNLNLNSLLTIIEEKIEENNNMMNSLYLNFCTNNSGNIDLNKYNNYNTAIICFIYNLFNILQINKKTCRLFSLDLLIDDITDEKEFIIKNIQNKIPFYKQIDKANLNELNLSRLYLCISNISLILPFNNFPLKIKELTLINLTYKDLECFVNTLKKNNNLFKKLVTLEISLIYMMEDFRKYIRILLKECISKNLINFSLEIPNNLSYEDIVDILDSIKKNENNEGTFNLRLSNIILSPKKNFLEQKIEKFKKDYKKEFLKRNIITDIKFNAANNKLFFSLKKLNMGDLNYYLNFIYCFNKIYNKNINNNINIGKNINLFENIFYFIGKFKEKDKNVTIEII